MIRTMITGIVAALLVFTASSLAAEAPPAPNVNASGTHLDVTAAQTHTVVKGDTLAKIAERYYGTQGIYCFPLILFANRQVVANPDEISPGMQLAIPELKLDLMNAAARAELKSYTMEVAWWYSRNGKTAMKDALISFADTL
ncbi:MAG: LysM peptidoglycan-binding domain-containing protein [Treponema sp.]|jgi:phage tail protein X|nr:LysM peptidoglycan-binding domain-containing protein [Treponema sp.]